MAILTVQKPALTGTVITYAAAAGGGDSFPNTGIEFLHVKNTDATPHDVIVDSPGTCNCNVANNAVHDKTVTITNGTEQILGPFPKDRFNDVNNRVQLTYSSPTGMSVAVVSAS